MTDALNQLLKATSRSFYLTLRVLPAAVRPQIGLAYLLARTTDTIADTELVPIEQRLDALQKLRERILGQNSAPLKFHELAQRQNVSAEKLLLEKVEASLALLQTLSPADLKLVREVLVTITSGQELDLRRFAPLESTLQRAGDKLKLELQQITALQTDAELDDYTYRVAGCVGEFWTKMCRAHLFPNAKLNDSFAIEFGERDAGIAKFFKQLDDSFLIQLGVRFGNGLQIVNILRDLAADLRKGRCYLPADKLTEAGLTPADLLEPANETRLRPLYDRYLDEAQAHLHAGWAYTNALPWRCARARLACAWPILIGVKTIQRLRAANMLDPRQPVKISRREVRQLMAWSVICYPWPAAWRRMVLASAPAAGKAVASGANLT